MESILQNEIWKDIGGYEGIYQVSNFGNVRSLDRTRILRNCYGEYTPRHDSGKLMSGTDNGQGYLIVGLKKDGNRENHYIHRLVADAFCERKENCEVINHLDHNRRNNCASNLEWCTQKDNVLYSAHLMRKPRRKCAETNTGEKYISLIRDHRNPTKIYYRLQAYSSQYRVCKWFATLEAAVKYRNEVMQG